MLKDFEDMATEAQKFRKTQLSYLRKKYRYGVFLF
jgi:hypothetical protein